MGAEQPHGSTRLSWTAQPGTGQRTGSQSEGRVVCVTVGQGVVVGGRGGSVMMVVVTTMLDVVLVLVVVGDHVGRVRVRVRVRLLVHVSLVDRNTTRHPSYGHSAPHGASSVAVGMAAGQPHGFVTVVTTRQAPSHACEHAGLTTDCVSVGHATSAGASGNPGAAPSEAAARWLLLRRR